MTYYPVSEKTYRDFGISVRSNYGWRRIKGGWSFHKGIDISPSINKDGNIIIIATINGVILNGIDSNGGLYCYIKGDNGQGHLTVHHKTFLRKNGERVRVGERIALMGTSGNSSGVHVHFEVRSNYHYSDSHYNPNPLYFLDNITMDFNKFLEWNESIGRDGKCAEVLEVVTKPENCKLVKNVDNLTEDQKLYLIKLKEFNDSIPDSVKNTKWLDTVLSRYGSVYLPRSIKE